MAEKMPVKPFVIDIGDKNQPCLRWYWRTNVYHLEDQDNSMDWEFIANTWKDSRNEAISHAKAFWSRYGVEVEVVDA